MDDNADMTGAEIADHIQLTAEIVCAYVAKNSVPPAEMPGLLRSVHASLAGLGKGDATEAPAVEKPTPIQIRKSITPEALISFIDGKPYKTLKRHLNGQGLTIEQYRERFGLPQDYSSTAASYSAHRSALAKSIGLSQQRRKATPKAAEPVEPVVEKPKRAGRPRKTKASVQSKTVA